MPHPPHHHPNGHNGHPNNGHPHNGKPPQGQAQSVNSLDGRRLLNSFKPDDDLWPEWSDLEDGLQNDLPAMPPPVVAPPPTFRPRDQDELNLYYLHSALFSVYVQLKPPAPEAQGDVADTLRYLEEKDLPRAALVSRCLQMAAYLVNEAAALLDEAMDWPTIEALMCPEEAFWDSPQNWLAVGQAAAQSGQVRGHDAENTHPERAPPDSRPIQAPPIEMWAEETVPPVTAPTTNPATTPMPPALAALVAKGMPKGAPTGASRRSFGRTLRTELESEKRRFYAIAGQHGLSTRTEDGDNIRAALSELFGIDFKSRKELTATQWSKAASALETDDLVWQAAAPKARPPAPRPRFTL